MFPRICGQSSCTKSNESEGMYTTKAARHGNNQCRGDGFRNFGASSRFPAIFASSAAKSLLLLRFIFEILTVCF
jgi:hypothetical protein